VSDKYEGLSNLPMSDTPRTSAWWRQAFNDDWPRECDMVGDLISDLAASERSDAIHLEALAESERLRAALEEDVKTYQSGADFLRERAEKAEADASERERKAFVEGSAWRVGHQGLSIDCAEHEAARRYKP